MVTFANMPKPMKNVLILTDFSEKSVNSLAYVLHLFKNKSKNIYLLHVVNDTTAINNYLNKLIDNNPFSKGHNFYSIQLKTDLIEATKEIVSKNKIDLIVIGESSSLIKKQTFRTTALEEVVTKVKCSILSVPSSAKFKGIHKMAFPTDYTNYYEAKLLSDCELVNNFNKASINFLLLSKKGVELNSEQRWNKETLEDYFSKTPHNFHKVINKQLAIGLEKFVTENSTDLLIIAAKNINLIEQLVLRPSTSNVAYMSQIPFLILHQPSF